MRIKCFEKIGMGTVPKRNPFYAAMLFLLQIFDHRNKVSISGAKYDDIELGSHVDHIYGDSDIPVAFGSPVGVGA